MKILQKNILKYEGYSESNFHELLTRQAMRKNVIMYKK
jgi:hypothetical protein